MNEPSTLPAVDFSSARDAAGDLNAAAQVTKDGPFYVFPFSKYEPDDTIWWLSPKDESTLNPSFKLGKIAVAPGRLAEPGALFIGLEVEKGIEAPAAEMFATSGHGRRMTMEPDWTWHAFIAAMRDSAIDNLAVAAEEAAGEPLAVAVAYSPQSPPSGDLRTLKADIARFQYAGGELSLIDESLEVGAFTGSGNLRSLAELADKITTMPKADWAWVEVLIGQRFQQATPGEPAWSASQIWERTCRPWKSWLR